MYKLKSYRVVEFPCVSQLYNSIPLQRCNLDIRPATPADYPAIQRIAQETWPSTFGEILTPEQIDYMLHWMYRPESLQEQVEQKRHVFLMATNNAGEDVGYVSYEVGHLRDDISKNQMSSLKTTKIHKLYLLPQTQGQGIGRMLIEAVAERAKAAGNNALILNVNRNNRAVQFYERLGFVVAQTEDIDIGNGYWMQDYVMVKPLHS